MPPKTWADLKQEAMTIRDKGIDQYPIAFGAVDWSWYLMALSMGDPMFDIAAPGEFFRPCDLVTFRREPLGQNCEGIQLTFITKHSSRTIPPFQATALT